MKKKFFAAVFLFVFLAHSVFAVYQETNASRLGQSGFGDLEVMSVRYEPYPVQPGKYFDVWFKVENRGTFDINSAQFELRPKYPFTLEPGDAAVKDIGRLGSFSAALIKYRVRVDADAVLGNTPLEYAYHENINNPWNEFGTFVYIQPRDLYLAVEDIALTPAKIGPGEKGTVTFTVKNHGDTQIENIKLKLGLADATVPLVPSNSIGEKSIDYLKPGKDAKISFEVIALADADSKIYKVPVELVYFDNLGKKYNSTSVFAAPIAKKPDLYFIVDSTTLLGEKTTGNVVIKAVNSGASGVKFLDLTILPSDDYEILSSPRAYVGKVDSDDYQTAEFTLYLKNTKDLQFSIPVQATFEDATNEQYSEKTTLTVNLGKTKYAQKSGSSLSTWIIAVLIIGVGYFVYRRWKKSKEKK